MQFYEASEYQPACSIKFQHYRNKILSLIPNAKVDHIGSSAISGAISKGDLDILVAVEKLKLEGAVIKLQSLGFRVKQDTLRTNELCMLESELEDVAFQVIALGSQFEMFLIFRNELLADNEKVKQYNELKRSCIGMSQDAYRAYKSKFIENVLGQA